MGVRHSIRTLCCVVVLMLMSVRAYADISYTQPTPYSATVLTQLVPTSLLGTGIILHKITWSTSGTVTGGACALESSVDNTFASPSTIIAAQTVTSSGGPTGWTLANANYVRIHCTTPITGTGSVKITYDGVNPRPTADINGNPITASNDPCYGGLPTVQNNIVASTTLVKILTKATGKKNYGCGILVINDAASTGHFSLIEGTQTTTQCDTGAVAILGSTTAANGLTVAASGLGFFLSKTFPGQSATQDWCLQNDGSNSFRVVLWEIQQ